MQCLSRKLHNFLACFTLKNQPSRNQSCLIQKFRYLFCQLGYNDYFCLNRKSVHLEMRLSFMFFCPTWVPLFHMPEQFCLWLQIRQDTHRMVMPSGKGPIQLHSPWGSLKLIMTPSPRPSCRHICNSAFICLSIWSIHEFKQVSTGNQISMTNVSVPCRGPQHSIVWVFEYLGEFEAVFKIILG